MGAFHYPHSSVEGRVRPAATTVSSSAATASTLSSLVVLEPTAGQGARVAQHLAVSEAPPGGVVGVALEVVGVDAEAGVGHIHGCDDDGDEEEGEGEFSHGEYYEDNGSCGEMFLRGKLEREW